MEDRDFIEFQDIKFFWHPFTKYYLASKCGKILSLKQKEKKILKLDLSGNGYLYFGLYKNNYCKRYSVSRFVFECFKGEIPVDKQVDHIDNCKENNSINNLQLLSPKENQQKSNCKKVISFNLETKEEKIFDSLKEAGEYFNIISSSVFKCCQKIIKTSKSKKDGKRYKFFYL